MSKKTVIISGGMLEKEFVLEELEKFAADWVIGADAGVAFLYEEQILPTYIVGDFDSLSEDIITYYKEETNVPIRRFNPVKDASDTEIAIRMAIELGSEEILILGGTGNRMDHIWANVQALSIAEKAGVNACMMDAHNRISIIEGETHLKKEEVFGDYFSIFPLGGSVEGLSISGAKYPLKDHCLTAKDSLCVSNQIAGDEAVITFRKGMVILMETRDAWQADIKVIH